MDLQQKVKDLKINGLFLVEELKMVTVEKIPDGRYYIRLGVPNAVSLKSSDLGNSNVFTIKNGKFVKAETSSTPKPDEKPTPKTG